MEKTKLYLARNWESILAGCISTIILTVLDIMFKTFWNFIGAFSTKNIVFDFVLWLIFGIGLAVVIYAVIRTIKRIVMGKNDSTIYPGLKLIGDPEGLSISNQNAKFGAGLVTSVELWVIVTNGDRDVYDCQVVPENLEFCSYPSSNIWVNAPGGFETKAMKWSVGYIPSNGKIDLITNSRTKLEIARAINEHPKIEMQLSYLDGYSHGYSSEGQYRITLRLDGKVLVNKAKKSIKTKRYTITFTYQTRILSKIKVESMKE